MISSRDDWVEPPPQVKVDHVEVNQVSSIGNCRMYRIQLQHRIWCTANDSLMWEPAKCVDGLQEAGVFRQ